MKDNPALKAYEKAMAERKRTVMVNFRLPRDLVMRLRQAVKDGKKTFPHGPSQTQIITHGIELVLAELKELERDDANDYL